MNGITVCIANSFRVLDIINDIVNNRQTMSELDSTLSALADPTRRRVVDVLRERPCRAGELAARASMSAPAMSRHLRVLRAGGLVEAGPVEHDARLRVYRLRPEPFAALQEWLNEVQTFWDDQLGAFKEHAERGRR
jgi:DNA-binding transcriptional ArsR family regulator